MDLHESGLEHVANAMREDVGQKRKREAESADDTRRGNKRVSPLNKAADHNSEALQDYANMHGDQNGADASSTAAAALAHGLYPTMTIPQPTDISFGTQGGSENDRGDTSFMDNSQAGGDSFMEQSTPSGRGTGSKPAVGSDEWHKVRKDNHKEGK
jgi:bHLH factor